MDIPDLNGKIGGSTDDMIGSDPLDSINGLPVSAQSQNWLVGVGWLSVVKSSLLSLLLWLVFGLYLGLDHLLVIVILKGGGSVKRPNVNVGIPGGRTEELRGWGWAAGDGSDSGSVTLEEINLVLVDSLLVDIDTERLDEEILGSGQDDDVLLGWIDDSVWLIESLETSDWLLVSLERHDWEVSLLLSVGGWSRSPKSQVSIMSCAEEVGGILVLGASAGGGDGRDPIWMWDIIVKTWAGESLDVDNVQDVLRGLFLASEILGQGRAEKFVLDQKIKDLWSSLLKHVVDETRKLGSLKVDWQIEWRRLDFEVRWDRSGSTELDVNALSLLSLEIEGLGLDGWTLIVLWVDGHLGPSLHTSSG